MAFSSSSSRKAHGQSHETSQQQTGTLSQLQGHVVVPSTLSYKERIELRIKDAFEYGRIYNTAHMCGVHDRLTADASVRQRLKAANSSAAQDSSNFAAMARTAATQAAAAAVAGFGDKGSTRRPQSTSGFVNNTPHLTSKQQASSAACSMDPPLSSLHPITLQSYHKKYPVDFMAAARPQARTMNETMRMMGMYSSDRQVAQRLGVHMPHGCSYADLTRQ